MAFAYQLELFENNDPVALLQKDFRILEKSCHSVRRGVFAEVSAFKDEIHLLRDLCISMKSEIELLKNKLEIRAEVIEFPIGGINESRNSG